MTEVNPYQTPEMPLIDISMENGEKHFSFFTAWAVFGLQIITFGYYFFYWLITRTIIVNKIHRNPIEPVWPILVLLLQLGLTAISIFTPGDYFAIELLIAIQVMYYILYLIALYKLHFRLNDIINQGSQQRLELNGILTFFFSCIYLQYKINEYVEYLNINKEVDLSAAHLDENFDISQLKVDGIDYSQYEYHELVDCLKFIDKEKYPERARIIKLALSRFNRK